MTHELTDKDLPLVLNFTQGEAAALRNILQKGYNAKEASELLGVSAQRLRKYNRIFERYGKHAFARG
jgi:uncharacterized protein YutE (UPF0331/DUF86 family)